MSGGPMKENELLAVVADAAVDSLSNIDKMVARLGMQTLNRVIIRLRGIRNKMWREWASECGLTIDNPEVPPEADIAKFFSHPQIPVPFNHGAVHLSFDAWVWCTLCRDVGLEFGGGFANAMVRRYFEEADDTS